MAEVSLAECNSSPA